MPAWAQYVERSTAAATSPPPATGDWQQAFARCLHPLLQTARADLPPGPLTEQFLHRLGLRLVRLASRTLVLELARARARGDLTGTTPAERFQAFTHRLVGGSELAEFLATYPVLTRLLGEACRQSVEAHLELLTRLAEDRALLADTFFQGDDPGPLTALEQSGDPHSGGRSTAILTFANGPKLVYKPRSLDLHSHFNDLVDWLSTKTGISLKTVRLVRRGQYGWLEHVSHDACSDLAGVRRFYQRQGALLALLYLLDGTDMHYQNLVAHGDHPVLVDVETLFHPDMGATGLLDQDPAHAALLSSVSRTALLPLLVSGENGIADMSGLGGDPGGLAPASAVDWADAGLDSMHLVRRPRIVGGGTNRPRLGSTMIEPRDHEAALHSGFQAAYQAISRSRDELQGHDGLLTRCAHDEMRYVPRPSRIYATLLDEMTHPEAARTADTCDSLLGLLWEADESLRPLVRFELADLWSADIPLFRTRPSSRDVWTGDGTRVPEFLAVEGLAAVEAKLARMNDVDQHRQQWVISASLATRPEPVLHTSPPRDRAPGAVEADPEQLLAAATDIADEIMAHVLGDSGHTANWLGLELLDDHHWAVLPMGAGLTNGYVGTALFLAQIGTLTGADKYCELARDAVRPLPRLLETLAAHPDAARAVGPGLHGLGGITYGLSRLSDLLDDSELVTWLEATLGLLDDLEPVADAFPGYGEGAAGGLTAMRAVQGIPAADLLATRYADELVAAVQAALPAPARGLMRGYEGIAWALGQHGSTGKRYHEASIAAAALDHADPADGPGWCSGAAGTTLARLSAGLSVDLPSYLRTSHERPVLADLSLCHGELGVVEPLLWLDDREAPAVEMVRRRRAGLVLAAVQQYGPLCGTPRSVPSPGLLTGLAGIGYGLLRLGFRTTVPSVLLQESAAGTGRPSQRHPAPPTGETT